MTRTLTATGMNCERCLRKFVAWLQGLFQSARGSGEASSSEDLQEAEHCPLSILGDVKYAHWLIKILPAEWGRMHPTLRVRPIGPLLMIGMLWYAEDLALIGVYVE